MLCKIQRNKLHRHLLVGGVLCAAAFGNYSCTDKYDLDTKQPDGLNSIYGYLKEQGNYNTCLQLIDDLGETEVLSKTGSKTMFIANDDAFKEFFASNSWNVKDYAGLTLAQKKILLYSAMIDNPYSTSMLSTATGPIKGVVCRRASSLTQYDSVLVVNSKSAYADEVLPKNYRFDDARKENDTIVLFQDASMSAPLVHFNYKFITGNRLQSSDVDFIYNQPAGTRQNDDVYINNSKIVEPNIFCKNGFIHKVDKVILPLDNMAEIIRKDAETSKWSSIVERFAVPYYTSTLTSTYNQLKGTDLKKVFSKRYFSNRSEGGALVVDDNDKAFEASLKFDPGWNGYACPKNGEEPMQENMAVMIVPTDEAFNDWWENGSGYDIQQFYKTLDNTPTSVLQRLINVNQLESMIASVPSRFADILDDANEPMGIKESDIESVTVGCNGLVYKTNKVFPPKAYSSVLFPVVVDTTSLSLIETAVTCMDYSAYLNSMNAQYIFLVPQNDGMLTYIDPVSYGQKSTKMWKFKLGNASKAKHLRISADVYDCEFDESIGKWVEIGNPVEVKDQDIRYINDKLEKVAETPLRNRLEKLLDNIIVTSAYEVGKDYYRTKGNSYVRIESASVGGKVYGGLQDKYNTPLTIQKRYDKFNGIALVLDGPIMGTNDNVAMVMDKIPEFSEFFELLKQTDILHKEIDITNFMVTAPVVNGDLGNMVDIKTYGDVGYEMEDPNNPEKDKLGKNKVTYLFNNYQYTMFVPTNDAMKKAYDAGLPTLKMIKEAEARDSIPDEQGEFGNEAACLREVVLDFIKYHIFDNSVFVDKGFESGNYESQKTELIFATYVEDVISKIKDLHYDAAGNVDSAMVAVPKVNKGEYAWYPVKKVYPDGSVEVYTSRYTSGKPFRAHIDVNDQGITIKDNTTENPDNYSHVIVKDGLYNIVAQEYWVGNKETDPSTSILKSTDNSTVFYQTSSSFIVLHAIDAPLIYADGEHYNANNDKVPTQFIYKYKPISSEARPRK